MSSITRNPWRCTTLALLSLIMLTGCSGPVEPAEEDPLEAGLAEFPAEKTAADFPGMSYPAHDGELPGPQGPLWLIGIDGATWDLIRPMAANGELPNFARLLEQGAHGVL